MTTIFEPLSFVKKHPIVVLVYAFYILTWAFFATAIIRINHMQAESGGRCLTGIMLFYFSLISLSCLYLFVVLFFAFFTKRNNIYPKLALAILVPIALALLWQLFW